MKWAVYWQTDEDNEFEVEFFKTEAEARAKCADLILECENTWDEGYAPNWDITLMEVKAESGKIPFGDGCLHMRDKS